MADIILTRELLEKLGSLNSLKQAAPNIFADYCLYFRSAIDAKEPKDFLDSLNRSGRFDTSEITSRDNEIIYFLTSNNITFVRDRRAIDLWLAYIKQNSQVWHSGSLFIIGTRPVNYFPKNLYLISQNKYNFSQKDSIQELDMAFKKNDFQSHGQYEGSNFFSIPAKSINMNSLTKSVSNFLEWLMSKNRRESILADLKNRFDFVESLEQVNTDDFCWILPKQLQLLLIPDQYIPEIVKSKTEDNLRTHLAHVPTSNNIKNLLLSCLTTKKNYHRPAALVPRNLLRTTDNSLSFQERMFAFFNVDYLISLGIKPAIAKQLTNLYENNPSAFEDELLGKILDEASYSESIPQNSNYLVSKYDLAYYASQFSRLPISTEIKKQLVECQSITDLLDKIDISKIDEKDIEKLNTLYIDYNKAYRQHDYFEKKTPYRPRYENHLGKDAESVISKLRENNFNQYQIITQISAMPDIVRGCAGSGKTLTGILKAYYIANDKEKRFRKILFLVYDEFIREEIEYRFRELQIGWALQGPDAIIEIKTLYQWCMDLQELDDSSNIVIDALGIENSILRKYYIRLAIQRIKDTASTNTVNELDQLIADRGINTIDEEISVFIKGRMASDDINLYLTMERTGAGTGKGLNRSQRIVIWEVFKSYEKILNEKKKLDKDDIFISTYKKLTDPVALRFRLEEKRFDYIIIDEAQDLFPLHIRLISHMVREESNILVLLDPTQTIYAREKVNLASLLREEQVNEQLLYSSQRCSREVLATAWSLFPLGYPGTDVIRPDFIHAKTGEKPVFCGFLREQDQFQYVLSELTEIERNNSVALISLKERTLNALQSCLRHNNINFNSPTYQVGSHIDVIFGHMVKGRQYDYVFVIGLDEQSLPLAASPWEPILDKERKRIYTMFTRTRKQLYVTWVGRPHPLIPACTNSFVHGTIANWSL